MSLPDDTCLELNVDLEVLLSLSIDMPGGIALSAHLKAGEFPSLPGIVGSLLEPLTAAMTPLMPFFRLLDVMIAMVEFQKAIPDALGPPPDPTLLIKRLKKVVKAFAKCAALVPFLSIPVMLVGICKVIVAALTALIGELQHIIQLQIALDLGRAHAHSLSLDLDLAPGAAFLEASLDCTQADLDLAITTGTASLGPLNKFFDLLNVFMDMIRSQFPGLPAFIKIKFDGGPIADFLQVLQNAVNVVGDICNNIPV